jgi:hypothetical protein
MSSLNLITVAWYMLKYENKNKIDIESVKKTEVREGLK